MYLDASNLYGWAMYQKLHVNGFEWVKEISQFNEDFIKNYDEDSNKGYFLEVDAEYRKNLFYLKERKLKTARSLFVPYIAKKTMLCT